MTALNRGRWQLQQAQAMALLPHDQAVIFERLIAEREVAA